TNTEVSPTINYHVQQLFSVNSGDTYLTTTVSDAGTPVTFAASSVRDTKTGDLILKLVNGANVPKPLHIELTGAKNLAASAVRTVLAGANPMEVNEPALLPQTATVAIAPTFDYE